MQKRFELTYDELFILLKEAYHNGYLAYEIVEAGLEPYDANGYARWILLRVKGDSDRRKKNDIEMKKAIQDKFTGGILFGLWGAMTIDPDNYSLKYYLLSPEAHQVSEKEFKKAQNERE